MSSTYATILEGLEHEHEVLLEVFLVTMVYGCKREHLWPYKVMQRQVQADDLELSQ